MQSLIKRKWDVAVFLLPALSILTQWISIAGIRLSWVLSILLLAVVLFKLPVLLRYKAATLLAIFTIVQPVISLLFIDASIFSFSLYASLIMGMAYLLFILLLDKKMFYVFLGGCVFACAVFAVWGCIETFTGYYLLFDNEAFFGRTNSMGLAYPGVAFANTNDLAQFLVMLLPFASCILLPKRKMLYVALMLLSSFVILQTESRLALLAFVGTVVVVLLLQLVITKCYRKARCIVFIMLAAILALVAIEVVTGKISTVVLKSLVVETDADYFSAREIIYRNLINAALQHPFGAFGLSYTVQDYMPHNLFLFILCDYGWLCAVLFLLLLAFVIVKLIKRLSTQREDLMSLVMLVSVCFFALTSCISSCNEQRKVTWLFLGCMLRWVYLVIGEKRSGQEVKA